MKLLSGDYSNWDVHILFKRGQGYSYFGPLMWRTDSLEETLMLGKVEGRRKRGWQRMRWLDGITDLWLWVSSGSWWWTGKSGVLQSMGHKESEQLNWTEGYLVPRNCSFMCVLVQHVQIAWFTSRLWHFLAVWLWLTFICFTIYKREILIVFTWSSERVVVRLKWTTIYKLHVWHS